MNDTAATTTPDPTRSTRTLADVKRHRRIRSAGMLRDLATRIESSDVDVAVIQFHREVEDVTPDGATERVVRAQRGQIDDETITIQLQLTPYDDAPTIVEPDPED